MSNRNRRTRRAPPRPRELIPRVHWSGFRPLFDFWGNEIKRFYKLETLARATEWMLQTKDRFLIPSIQDVLGPSPVTSLAFELFQEGKYQLIFRLVAGNARRKQTSFAFVVAKHHEDYSQLARTEHHLLRVLNARAPRSVVKPFRGGPIYLPDRHKRLDHGREVYAYVTQWFSGFYELGVNRDLQFFLNVAKPHTFTIAQTEALKGAMIEIIVRTYDPVKRECMDIPQIASGDFVASDPSRGAPKLRLIACRRMLTNVTPAKLIHRIAAARWNWNGRDLYLAPADPAIFVQAVARAVGEDQARAWFKEYAKAVDEGRFPEQVTLPLDELETILRNLATR